MHLCYLMQILTFLIKKKNLYSRFSIEIQGYLLISHSALGAKMYDASVNPHTHNLAIIYFLASKSTL